MEFQPGPVTVRVPASSANLGPGFDALGLALAWYDEVTVRVSAADTTTTVTVSGEGAGELPTDDRHLVVRAMDVAFDALGVARPGLSLHCRNRIPQARGLGSSAAAVVAGLLAARALVRDGRQRLDDTALLRLAAEVEGHPDNVAACLLGGLTVAWTSGGQVRAARLTPAPQVRPVVFVPDQRGLTEAARAALPERVPHADAAHAAGRAALLVHALTSAPEHLFDATEDRLHQPYRAAGMPDSAALLNRLRARGVAAVISGAGPSVLALTPVPPDVAAGPRVSRHELAVDHGGAVVTTG
ncbi:MAG: homoserine kinase [Micromonosporaceae bacterium]